MSRRPRAVLVHLNVYDLYAGNDMLAPLGLGLFHTGLEVHGSEYSYGGGGGIIKHRPRSPPTGSTPGSEPPFRLQLLIGSVEATSFDVERVVDSMRGEWAGNEYHLLARNCNCFSDELAIKLTGKRIPGWINRMAGLALYFSCILPENLRPPPSPTGQARGGQRGQGRGTSQASFSVPSSSAAPRAQALTVRQAEDERVKRAAAAERRLQTGSAAHPPIPALSILGVEEDGGERAPLTGSSGARSERN